MPEVRNTLSWILPLLAALALASAAPQPREQNRFAWVPSYPGAKLLYTRTTRDRNQLTRRSEFDVHAQTATVRRFFEDQLKAAGFNIMGKGGVTGHGWDLRADHPGGTRTIDISGNAQSEGVHVGVTARMLLRAPD